MNKVGAVFMVSADVPKKTAVDIRDVVTMGALQRKQAVAQRDGDFMNFLSGSLSWAMKST